MNGLNAASSETNPVKNKSYGGVLKSSALIGGSAIVEIGFRVLRTKAMALLVGPAGIGLLGVYVTVGELVRNVAGMGLKTSGVRQIAEAVGTGDVKRIARTVKALRRVALLSGVVGASLLLATSRVISSVTFGNYEHAGAFALLAVSIPLSDISDAQAALIQGMRRISDLAMMTVLGALYGTVISVVLVYVWGEKGLVPSLVCVSAMGIVTSWWYARRIEIDDFPLTLREIAVESSHLLTLGTVFMASGFMLMGSAYLVRLIIVRRMGIEAAGYFQAAWAVGGLYTGLVLRAMAADFYPRLTAVAGDNEECNRLMNEQAEVVLLLACPGVLATLTFAPVVIGVFYSVSFSPAVAILRWICLGTLLQVLSWSMGFIVIAKGKQWIFLWCELASNLMLLTFVWFGVIAFGLEGTGMALFGMYGIYSIGIYLVVRRVSGFRLSAENRRLAMLFLPLVVVVFVAWYVVPASSAVIVGMTITLFAGIYSLKTLCRLVSLERLPNIVRRILALFRLTPEQRVSL